MNIQIKYFGVLTDVTGCNAETLNVEGNKISDVLDTLFDKYLELRTRDFQIAQGETTVSKEAVINGLEIALLPPFSGG